MSETTLDLTINKDVAEATFKTDGGLNVLSSSVIDRIAEVAQEVKSAPNVRYFILGAEGKVFVAGANIKELSTLDAAGAAELSNRGNKAFDAIADLPCITIARLHGAALGGRASTHVRVGGPFRSNHAFGGTAIQETPIGTDR